MIYKISVFYFLLISIYLGNYLKAETILQEVIIECKAELSRLDERVNQLEDDKLLELCSLRYNELEENDLLDLIDAYMVEQDEGMVNIRGLISANEAQPKGLVNKGIHVADELMEEVKFCSTCHVMDNVNEEHSRSSHNEIYCTHCHVKQGVKGFVQSKLDGLPQAAAVLTQKYGRKQIIPEKIRDDLAEEVLEKMAYEEGAVTCSSCHIENGMQLPKVTQAAAKKAHARRLALKTVMEQRGETGNMLQKEQIEEAEKTCVHCHSFPAHDQRENVVIPSEEHKEKEKKHFIFEFYEILRKNISDKN